jgi:regulator of cell morphogenesis and NO signaling
MSMTTSSPNSRFADQSMGAIASELPGAAAVFRRHKLDFCCGGAETLASAAHAAGLDGAAIEAELAALDVNGVQPPSETGELIAHILTRFHETHRREVPELIALARKVEDVHAGHPEVPKGLAAMLEDIGQELEAHMQKEEQILFPMMRRGGNPMIVHPIDVMRHEHDEHGARLRKLEALTHDHRAPAEACSSWLALYAGTRKLVDDVMQHIHLENNVLFPRYEAQ